MNSPQPKLILFRQGDVLLEQCETVTLPKTRKFTKSLVLALGEATGHSHTLRGNRVAFLPAVEKFTRVFLPDGGTMVHQEHGPIDVPPGVYRIRLQREFGINRSNGRQFTKKVLD